MAGGSSTGHHESGESTGNVSHEAQSQRRSSLPRSAVKAERRGAGERRRYLLG
jgi:hypothetical protein